MIKKIERNTILKGAGVSLALPLLEIMKPAFADSSASDAKCKRLVAISLPFGANEEAFHPKDEGFKYSFPEGKLPLKDLRDHFTSFSNFDHNITGGHSAHHALWTGIKTPDRSKYPDGNITIDQRVVELVGHSTRFPSLHFWNDGMSFTRTGVKVPSLEKPSEAFKMMFVEDSQEKVASNKKAFAISGSILDTLRESSKNFNAKLGKRDQHKMEEYFTSVRDAEKKIQAAGSWLDIPKPEVTGYDDIVEGAKDDNSAMAPYSEVWIDLILLALKTNSTKVITMAGGGSNWGLPGTDLGSYHFLSHHGNKPEKLKALTTIDQHMMKLMAKLITELKKEIDEDGRSLLETTQLIYGSGLGNGRHSTKNLPIVLAGGNFKHGQHINNNDNEPLCNLYLQMLRQFEPEMKYFNKSKGEIKRLETV